MNDSSAVGWRFLLSRRWIGYFALLIVFSIACVWLGNWQFERRADAQAEIARIDSNYDAPAISLDEAFASSDEFDEDSNKWQPVELHGEYVGETYLARNRPSAGGVGSNLINAFHSADGSIFYVDRGWVPITGADEIPSDLPAPPEGEVTVTARLLAAEPEISGRTSVGYFVPSINPAEIARVSGIDDDELYSASYGRLIEEQPTSETGALAPRPERDEGPHLSYALQWYVFILIAVIGVAYAARQEHRNFNPDGELERKEDRRREERKKRKGPTDADIEDALLDA